jgi:hypothetical protein
MAYSARYSVQRKLPALMTATLALLVACPPQDPKLRSTSGLDEVVPRLNAIPGTQVDEQRLTVEVIP